MKEELSLQLAELNGMTARQLQVRFHEVFGHASASGNREYLRKRIAWRLQSEAEGDLSERARKRAAELANEHDLRSRPPFQKILKKESPHPEMPGEPLPIRIRPSRDRRLPSKGVILTRMYKGENYEVTVGENCFWFRDKQYRTLSGIAREITGTKWNGFRFFGLED